MKLADRARALFPFLLTVLVTVLVAGCSSCYD